jgi:hypothetical protein
MPVRRAQQAAVAYSQCKLRPKLAGVQAVPKVAGDCSQLAREACCCQLCATGEGAVHVLGDHEAAAGAGAAWPCTIAIHFGKDLSNMRLLIM